MPFSVRICLACALCLFPLQANQAQVFLFANDTAPWSRIFSTVGLPPVEAPGGTATSEWLDRVSKGAWLILEGDCQICREIGFRPGGKTIRAISASDHLHPDEDIVWETAAETALFEIPPPARIFTRERWSGAPLVAGFPHGGGGVLWTALPPGARGYERFPFLLHALSELGLEPPYRSRRLWVFFDSSYRLRADPDYLAERWRRAGVRGLHVAGWHYFEPDPLKDAYLHRLIESCHRQGILVYLWLELPHVSERFWADHPEWREKTALQQDAHLDWRKLMNLVNPECFRAVAREVRSLAERFDWDGVNLAELYFESLQGHDNPSRFTPMNLDVRSEFRQRAGFDPLVLFDPASPRHLSRNAPGLRKFLDFRSSLALRLQGLWLRQLDMLRRSKPHLDLVLTHVDDRLDPAMRDAIGSDSRAVLPLARRYGAAFLVEDPATVWHLGPERYELLAARYQTSEGRGARLGVDINIVERYQDVYPTKRPAGIEVVQLAGQAARSFTRVALYIENSIQARDVPWLSSAAATVSRIVRERDGLRVESPHGFGLRWQGGAELNGRSWPALDGSTVWIPPGSHVLTASRKPVPARLLDFSGELESVRSTTEGLEILYKSEARAFAIFDKRPSGVKIDGRPSEAALLDNGRAWTLVLPPGQHSARVEIEAARLDEKQMGPSE